MTEGAESVGPLFLRPTELEAALGYEFADRQLFQRALTHGSLGEGSGHNNERLEFLGDSVLGLATSVELFRNREGLSEGEMTRVRAMLVSRKSMAEEAKRLEVARFLRVGKMFADASKITDTVVSNALEAILGAIFLEAGFETASTPPELAALGMLAGEIPAAAFHRLQADCRAGRFPGVTSVEADGTQTIQGKS